MQPPLFQKYMANSAKKFKPLSIIPEASEKEHKLHHKDNDTFLFDVSKAEDIRAELIYFCDALDTNNTGIINFNRIVKT